MIVGAKYLPSLHNRTDKLLSNLGVAGVAVGFRALHERGEGGEVKDAPDRALKSVVAPSDVSGLTER